ncbi:hypothetical protein FHG87_013927 [Trinorchestia longiramus]|nr:hypothetical protein FHG87_013927 [Trinorchestia longiramus]
MLSSYEKFTHFERNNNDAAGNFKLRRRVEHSPASQINAHTLVQAPQSSREDPSSDYADKVKFYTSKAIGGNVLNYTWANLVLKKQLSSFDYEIITRNKNAEECFMMLQEKIAATTEHHIPAKRI